MNRRRFIQSLVGTATAVASTRIMHAHLQLTQQHALLITPYSQPSAAGQNHFIAILDKHTGALIADIPTRERCHGGCIHPTQPIAVVFGRRPSTSAYVIDTQTYTIIKEIKAEANHHFYGHGLFSKQSNYLVSTEQHFPTHTGVLVFRDINNNFAVVNRMETHGIGPHEIIELNHQPIIAIANGGIKTHPSWPRKKLNLGNMLPNLTYLNIHTGKVASQINLPRKSMSIRHLAIQADDTVVFVQQDEVKSEGNASLIATHKMGQTYHSMVSNKDVFLQLKSYVGSVAVMHNQALVTSPRGNIAMLWDLSTCQLINSFKAQDVCGCIADHTNNRFILSTGKGKLFTLSLDSTALHTLHDYSANLRMWDNHMISLAYS